MNRKMQKILSILLTLCMLLTNAPVPALAADTGTPGASAVNGEYANGVWTEGGSGSITHNVDGTEVTLSKTAEPVPGMENYYDITLRVETSTTTTTNTYYNAGAVVLVIDVSGSMAYCADCGNQSRHEDDCPRNVPEETFWGTQNGKVTTADSRMNAAKAAAQNFLSNYAGDDPNATRMLAIVPFSTTASTKLNWVNVAGGGDGYNSAVNAINGLAADGGTNLEQGLSTAKNLLAQDAVSQIESKNVIALTDGVPTYYGSGSRPNGGGSSGSKATNDATATAAEAVRDTGATLYTVCFGVADEVTYSGGPTVGNFLRNSIASAGKAYDADNSSELYYAFSKITESITSGLTGSDWTASDTMGPVVDFVSAPGNFAGSGDNYTWTLGNATEIKVEGDTTTYIYEVTYRVMVDVQREGFVEGEYYPANEPTYLNLTDGTKLEFPVPGVSGRLPRTDVTITKEWVDADNQDGKRPDSVNVQLKAPDGKVIGEAELNEDNGWSYTWNGEEYNLIAQAGGKDIVYLAEELDLSEDYVASYSTGDNNFVLVITNTHEVEKQDITVTKVWDDANNQDGIRPATVTVNLLADGEVVDTAELTAADGWTHTFKGYDVYKAGTEIVYTVEETNVPEGYEASVDGFVVTNSHETAKTSVTVNKIWDDADNQDGKRPTAVTIELFANGEATGKTLDITGSAWTGTFENLDEYANGEKIIYTVVEKAVSGYTTTYSEDTLTITNTHVPEVTEVSGSKEWIDNNNQDGVRPESININLLANGQIKDTATVTENDNWAWNFTNLPKYEAGELIQYSITETAVEGYSTSYNGYNVINTHTPAQTSVTVTKVWDDNKNQDGIRANDITIVLLADGVDTGKTLVLNDGNSWTGSFEMLDEFKNGVAVKYTIAEISVEGYTTEITGSQTEGYTVTNTHTPATVEVAGSKNWVDNDNQDGVRPESITINVLKNGEVVASKTVTEADGWAWNFTDLPKFENGELIKYVISEDSVEGYVTEYDGYNVINTHAPAKTSVRVTKSWQDNNDQDGLRPNTVTVELLANGVKTGKTLILNEGNSWADTFSDLDKFAAGVEVVYTVEEIAVPGYTTTISGNAGDGFTITNVHVPETFVVSGSKTWLDNNDQDGARPDSITIQLLKNGEVIETKNVTEADGWAWSFENLAKYENHGTLINYTVKEAAVEGYTTTYDGYNVTNTHNPEKISVTVNKAWSDNNNQDGIRANSVTIHLFANGTDTGKTLVLNEGNLWEATFDELDKFQNGQEIIYTVTEDAVTGYETVITGDAANGFVVTNSHTPATVEISGAKTWKDNDDQDGVRPDDITIHLLADGEVVDTLTVTADDGWAWSFENMPKFKQGVLIAYTVTEEAVENYTTEYDGYNVINTHAPEKTSITVSKHWEDSNDQDGKRPNDIKIHLLADGQDTGKTLTLNEGNWTGTFSDLDVYQNGKAIVYSIKELDVTGYESVISGNQNVGFIVTNSYNPETIDIVGAKDWQDNNDQDGKRPDSITVHLLKNGQVMETLTVTAEDDWSWSFTNLPKYENHGTLINYTITEDNVDYYVTTTDGYNLINTHAPEKTSVTVTKSWQDNNDQDGIRPESVTIHLLANGTDTGKTLVLSDGNKWSDTFADLDKYLEGEEIAYTVTEDAVTGYETVISGSQTAGFTVTNSHTPEVVTISGSKEWKDNDDQDGKRPESITIQLLKNGVVFETKVVTEEDGWAWSFENLAKYENGGKEIEYAIKELAVENYVTEYNGYNVINTHAPEKTSVTVTKSWVDNNNQDGIRPAQITVKLLADGADTGLTLILNEGNKWNGSFTDLDVYKAGEVIEYSVEELTVPGYNTVISGSKTSGYTITNSHTPEVVTISGSKEWKDNNNQDGKRPESITINLLKNGEITETITVTAEDNWSWSFEDMPKYEAGQLITYSITEEAVEGYTTEYNNYNVINTHAPEKTSVTVSKAWADSDNQDGIRPNDVTVHLLADGVDTGKTVVLSNGNNWTDSFTDLDKYSNGAEIVYTVSEDEVPGYTAVISGNQNSGYIITNSHTPATVSFFGEKTWDDNDNQDGFRPESITINLLGNGKVVKTITVTEEDGWKWMFENLPEFENQGSRIYYSITENAVEGYTTTYDGYNVINVHTPEEISLTVSKAWEDNNDQDGIRPDEITVILLADGAATGETLVLSAEDNWTGSFTGLDKYADGVEIVYSIDEVEVEGYDTVITGDMTTGYIITNSHTPETISISGTKTWNDADNQDGVRPESITVNLMANGQLLNTVTVTEAEKWSYSFENLPKFENGVEIVYAITEEAVEGYTTTYDGYNIINSYTPAEVSLTVTKAWADSDNKDGLRPDEVTIVLYADDELTDTRLILTAEGNWSGSFVGLPKYANGVEIVYTIGEIAVEGYNTVIRGDMASGFVVTNSHTVIPQTGDERTPMLWMFLMLASVAVVAYVGFDSKKKRSAK